MSRFKLSLEGFPHPWLVNQNGCCYSNLRMHGRWFVEIYTIIDLNVGVKLMLDISFENLGHIL